MRKVIWMLFPAFLFPACTESICDSPKAICQEVSLRGGQIGSEMSQECTIPLLSVDGPALNCKKIAGESGGAIYGSFSGKLLYNKNAIHQSFPDELCFFAGYLKAEEELSWIKIIKTGASRYSASDLGYTASIAEDGQILMAFTTAGKCQLIDGISGSAINLCAAGIFAFSFNQSGKLLWSCDFGVGGAAPFRILKKKNHITISLFNNGDFYCGCEGEELKDFSFADIQYALPGNTRNET